MFASKTKTRANTVETNSTGETQRLAQEVKRLRIELAEAQSTIRALEESNNATGPSWLQAKNSTQRKVLRTLNSRIRAQRIVLREVNKRGVGPDYIAIREAFKLAAEAEKLNEEEIEAALAYLR